MKRDACGREFDPGHGTICMAGENSTCGICFDLSKLRYTKVC